MTKKLLTFFLFAFAAFAQHPDLTTQIHVTQYTVAGLPGAPAAGSLATVTDGNGYDCVVGGGTVRQLCQYNAGWKLIKISICPSGMVCASDYGFITDAQWIADAVFTNTQPTVSSHYGAGLFKPTDCTGGVGCTGTANKYCFGTNMTTDTSAATTIVVMADCQIIAYTDANHITTNVNATATTNGLIGGTGGFFVWGTLTNNDTNLENAWTAAYTSGKNLYFCGTALVSSSHFNNYGIGNVAYGNAYGATSARRGYGVQACGMNAAMLIPVPAFNPASCTGGATGIACFLGAPSMFAKGFTIHGMGNSQIGAGFNGKNLVEFQGATPGLNVKIDDMLFEGWGASTAAKGIAFTNNISGILMSGTIIEAFGQPMFYGDTGYSGYTGQTSEISNSWLAPVNGSNQAIFNSGSWSLAASGWSQVVVQNSAIFNDHGGIATWNPAPGVPQLTVSGAGTMVRLNGTEISSATAGSIALFNNGGTIHIHEAYINNSALAANTFYVTGSGVTYDDGGNFIGGANSGAHFPAGSIVSINAVNGVCTGVSTASQTLGLYGTGANVIATTCTSLLIGTGQVMNHSGNLQFLQVQAGAAGVAAGSGVFTVLKNGGATTLTCTVGIGTSCTDGAHVVAFVAGDLISINFTTQALETLANAKASVSIF